MTKAKYKNYYIGVVIALLIIFAILYYFKIYESAKLNKYKESYLLKSGTINLSINLAVNELSEFSQVFSETPEGYFVFITYAEDEAEYKLETKLKPIIDDYGIKDVFYLVDTTNKKDDDEIYDTINDKLKLNKDKINSIPIIVYFSEKDYHIIDPNKLENFLKKNNFEKVSQ